jgi:hypothetical protein
MLGLVAALATVAVVLGLWFGLRGEGEQRVRVDTGMGPKQAGGRAGPPPAPATQAPPSSVAAVAAPPTVPAAASATPPPPSREAVAPTRATAPESAPRRRPEPTPVAAPPTEAPAPPSVAAPATQPAAPATAPPAPATQPAPARLVLHTAPWAEVYVNGALKGRTPYLRELSLPPGDYRVELRNPGLPTHTEQLTLAAGQVVTRRIRLGE